MYYSVFFFLKTRKGKHFWRLHPHLVLVEKLTMSAVKTVPKHTLSWQMNICLDCQSKLVLAAQPSSMQTINITLAKIWRRQHTLFRNTESDLQLFPNLTFIQLWGIKSINLPTYLNKMYLLYISVSQSPALKKNLLHQNPKIKRINSLLGWSGIILGFSFGI